MALICDTLRSASMNYDDPHQVEEVLTKRIEKTYHEAQHSAHTLQIMADGLPALGIVAAVLGVIKTMASIDQPPEILGKMIGGALVGTFLGVFLAYGLVGPFANRVKAVIDEDQHFYNLIREVMVAALHNHAPNVCVEVGRQNTPPTSAPPTTSSKARCAPPSRASRHDPQAAARPGARRAALPALAAEGGPIRGGEHGDFSRIVMPIEPTTEWSLETVAGRATIRFPGKRLAFDTAGIFAKMPTTRIQAVRSRWMPAGTPSGRRSAATAGSAPPSSARAISRSTSATASRRAGASPPETPEARDRARDGGGGRRPSIC